MRSYRTRYSLDGLNECFETSRKTDRISNIGKGKQGMYEKPSVLIVGSDDAENGTVSRRLVHEQYTVLTACNWTDGLRQLYSERPNALVLLLDVRWPDIELVRSLAGVPMIIVADRAPRASLQKALDLGVEGYLVRPLDYRRLMERVAFALQRTRSTAQRREFIQDNLVIDWRRFEVRIDGQLVHLGPIEFRLLSLLVQHHDEVVTYGEILTRVWGSNYDLSERRNIKQYIWYLRQKIERDPSRPRWIQTKPGVGYIFCPDPSESAPAARSQVPLRPAAMLAS